MNPEPTLKPCPFCGNNEMNLVSADLNSDRYFVTCGTCLARGPLSNFKTCAKTSWNIRHQQEQPT